MNFRSTRFPVLQAALPVCVLLLWPMATPAQEANPDGRPEFQSFRLITERNIFNPNRSARRESTRTTDRVAERQVRVESVALLGTMNYEKGWLAFFDGSDPDYRKALQPGDTIAGHKIAEIAANYVKLESGTNQPIELRVGAALKKQDEGAWEVMERMETSLAATTSDASPASDTNASDGESDIIKRLMQQREQELQK